MNLVRKRRQASKCACLLKNIWVVLEAECLLWVYNTGSFGVFPTNLLFIICIEGHACQIALLSGILQPRIPFKPILYPCAMSIGLAIAVHVVETVKDVQPKSNDLIVPPLWSVNVITRTTL